jgi:hypothetical protein
MFSVNCVVVGKRASLKLTVRGGPRKFVQFLIYNSTLISTFGWRKSIWNKELRDLVAKSNGENYEKQV